MNDWINEQLQNFDFNRAPRTKKLMRDYLSCNYEDSADYSDESMKRELILLNDNNQVVLMCIQEMLDNPEGNIENSEDEVEE